MKIGLIIAGGVIALLGLLFAIRMIALHYVTNKGTDAIAKHYKPDQIVRSAPQADGRGLLSAGVAVRGNGALVLTSTEIAWLPLVGADVTISLDKVTRVDIVNTHNGYSGRPLLQVHFQTATGTTDAWAWLVPDPEDWKRDIESQRGANR